MVKSSYLTNALKGWYDKFAEYAGSDDKLSKTEVDELRKMYEDAYNKAQNLYDSALEVAGIDKSNNGSSQSASSGYSVSMDQDTGDKLVGIATGSQMRLISLDQNVAKIAQWNAPFDTSKFNLDSIAAPLGVIGQSSLRIERMMEENRNIAMNSYYELKDINKNTKELYEMNDRLGEMNRKLDNI